MEINGKPAWEVEGIEPAAGYVGIQVEVPGGGEFEYKDILITELGYRSLFDGQDLAGWEGRRRGRGGLLEGGGGAAPLHRREGAVAP